MNPALLVIDVQQGIDEAAHWGGNRNNPEAENNIVTLLDAWRKKRLHTVIVGHISTSIGSPFYKGKPGTELKDCLRLMPGEEVIYKNKTNAFLGTTLNDRLQKNGITELVITGFVTNNSVEATARVAAELGYKITVVSDATACFDSIGVDGKTYSSELIHQISLSNLHHEYAEIKTTQQVLVELQEKTN